MPIQQIGGRNVYIITGTNTDPSKTSTGQSWANLVTQQKYMLFQEAQKQALQELQRADADFAAQTRLVERQRRALEREIADNRDTMRQLMLKELGLEGVNRRQSNRLSNASGGSRGVVQKTPNLADVQSHFSGLISAQERIIAQANEDNEQLKQEKLQLENDARFSANPANIEQQIAVKNEQIRNNDTRVTNATAERTNLSSKYSELTSDFSTNKAKFNREYNQIFGIRAARGGQSRSTPATPQTQVPVDFDTQSDLVEDNIKKLEQELAALKDPERQAVDLIPRQSQIYQQYFGDNRPASRQAEMNILGVEPEPEPQPIQQPRVEPEVQPESTPEEAVEPQPRTYTVQSGDTLGDISQQMYGTPDRFRDIAEASGVTDPNVIEVGQQLTVPPSPTPSLPNMDQERINRLRAIRLRPERFGSIGRRMLMEEAQPVEAVQQQAPTFKQRFADIKNSHPNQKKLLAMRMIQELANDLGVSNPKYKTAKKQVLEQLQISLDPSKAQQMQKVRTNQTEAPSDYYNLGTMIKGVNEPTRRLVASLFPVSDDTTPVEIESLYKNAQQQIALSIKNPTQKQKAQELLDLQYLAVLEDKR